MKNKIYMLGTILLALILVSGIGFSVPRHVVDARTNVVDIHAKDVVINFNSQWTNGTTNTTGDYEFRFSWNYTGTHVNETDWTAIGSDNSTNVSRTVNSTYEKTGDYVIEYKFYVRNATGHDNLTSNNTINIFYYQTLAENGTFSPNQVFAGDSMTFTVDAQDNYTADADMTVYLESDHTGTKTNYSTTRSADTWSYSTTTDQADYSFTYKWFVLDGALNPNTTVTGSTTVIRTTGSPAGVSGGLPAQAPVQVEDTGIETTVTGTTPFTMPYIPVISEIFAAISNLFRNITFSIFGM